MKKTLLFSLMWVFTATAVNAQHKNIIKIRPLTAAIGNYDLMFERGLGSRTSVIFEFSIFKYDTEGTSSESWVGISAADFSGYMVTPQFRYYFKGESPKGFYMNPFLQYGKYAVASSSTDQFGLVSGTSAALNVRGLGLGIGYQWQLGLFTIDWNFLGLAAQSWGLDYKYELASVDNLADAQALRDMLNEGGVFKGFEVKSDGGLGLEVKSPSAAILPMLKTNFSIGVCF